MIQSEKNFHICQLKFLNLKLKRKCENEIMFASSGWLTS